MIVVTGLVLSAASTEDQPTTDGLVEKIVSYLKGNYIAVQDESLRAMVSKVCDESRRRDIDYRLALAVIKVESNFRHHVVGPKGSRGLFQIKPCLAKHIARDAGVKYSGDQCLHEPEKNIKLGVYHLSRLVDDYENLPTALHAYNAGTSRVKPRPFGNRESKTPFTKRVMKEYQKNISMLPEMDEELQFQFEIKGCKYISSARRCRRCYSSAFRNLSIVFVVPPGAQ